MITGALERVLADHFGSPIALRAEPSPISGGFWASIYGFEIAGGESGGSSIPHEWLGRLVLRVMPNRERAVHEIIVQRAVADTGFPTPPVLHDGYDDALGGAFMIMPYATGKPPMAGLGPGSLLSVPRLLRRLPVQLAEVAVQLHAVDPEPIRLALEQGGLGGRVDGAQSRLEAVRFAAEIDSGGFDQLLTWFEQRRPHDPPLVLCHGDLHPFNLLIDDDGRTTVLDWTNAELMPREFEIGFTAGLVRCAPIKVPRVVRPLVRRLTAWMAQRFIETYERTTTIDAERVAWYEALQHSRCLAEVVTARIGLSNVVDANHPFETSAAAMTVRLAELTGVTISLPTRQPAPAS